MSDDRPTPPPKDPGRSPSCLVCGEGLTRRNLVLCRDCQAPHHDKCWSFNRGCATYACSCRTFVAPPGGVGDRLEFELRGRPNLLGVLTAFVVYFLAAALLKPYVLLPKALAKIGLRFLKPLCWAGVFTSILGPLVTRRRYEFDRLSGKVARRLLVGSIPVQSQADWLEFGQVAGLEVRMAEVPGKLPFESRRGVEVWLRDEAGGRHLVDRGIWDEREAVLRQAADAAELLDTTLGLPRGLAESEGLPAGMGGALARLPPGGRLGLPESE